MAGRIVYSSPFVPPEWIAAYGLAPQQHLLSQGGASAVPQGRCPFANDFVTAVLVEPGLRGVVMASTCDQMRRSAEQVAAGPVPMFLLNVPATWQSESSKTLYAAELVRLGNWLVKIGGTAPGREEIINTMRQFDARRRAILSRRQQMTARQFAEAISQEACQADLPPPSDSQKGRPAEVGTTASAAKVRMALVGGPLRPADFWLYDLLEELGVEVALDATETGERGLPAPFDERRMQQDPTGELVRAYFDTIPDAFRRPDTLLHKYLRRRLPGRQVQALVLVRHPWCDHWHAQYGRLREELDLPVVQIDLAGSQDQLQRIRTRIESLVNIVQ